MQVYYDAGLCSIASKSGYHGETLTSLAKASNFGRTHQFLLQVSEALYRAIIQAFLQSQQSSNEAGACNITEKITETLKESLSNQILRNLLTLLTRSLFQHELPTTREDFLQFISQQTAMDDTWKFWCGFLFEDVTPYICLYIAIRTRKWSLRVASIKNLIPLFTAFDRTVYQRILPQHLADLLCMPASVLQHFKEGGFTAALTKTPCASVAIDEAQETKINKDCKMGITRPTEDNMYRLAKFFTFCTEMQNKLKQILTSDDQTSQNDYSPFTRPYASQKTEENSTAMLSIVSECGL